MNSSAAREDAGGATPARRNHRGRWWLGALLVLAVVVAILRGVTARPVNPQYGISVGAETAAPDFTLDSTLGRQVSLSEFRDKIVLLYFGYTSCPDICPTTLADVTGALAALGRQQDEVQVLFVSVDPERDTLDRLEAYVTSFDPGIIGLSGSLDKIEAIASRFGVIFKKRPGENATDYFVDHTSAVLAIDRDGVVRFMFPYGTSSAGMASDVAQLIP